MLKNIVIIIALMFLLSCNHTIEIIKEPLNSAFKPTFISTEGTQEAGTAFVVFYKEGFYAVTAHHLFSKSGGFSREYSWKELSKLVSKTNIRSLNNEKINYSSSNSIVINNAKSLSNHTGKHDIAIFKLDQKPTSSLNIAISPPKVGEPVWLYGLVYNRSEKKLLHEAIVVEYDKNWISYQFKDPGLFLNGTSGAAIINQQGEVVGINLSGGEQDGKLFGYGNPLSSIQETFGKYVQ